MADVDADRWRLLSPHLDEALDLAPGERPAWLASLRRRDPRLAGELQSLLNEHGALARDGFLDGTAATLVGDGREGPHSGDANPPTGAATPRYVLGEEHARGGMGRILRGTDTYLQRRVAIKELLFADPGAEARFVREARLTARLEHPSVVPVHDVGRWQASGKLFYSMKLVSGRPLN